MSSESPGANQFLAGSQSQTPVPSNPVSNVNTFQTMSFEQSNAPSFQETVGTGNSFQSEEFKQLQIQAQFQQNQFQQVFPQVVCY